ncbi:hypothetical protein DEU56DRAFT_919564 [Suillus clintonianus]|uniref:uncharacterized protein n=1 Tax=Suillus clintonianus TaxID=1904413 RepID=UPI001B86F4DC|nr:uncharacterized protein DEU56DRAFT_919564 [Suillus clintonianus]KAG2114542.1 hypothetical protein DEU56DRAFT_919564 [Suillus clintonianus]
MGRQRGQQVGVPSLQVVESDIDNEPVTSVQPPRHRSNRPGAGAGGRNSQLEKIGNALQTLARAPGKSKVQNVVVPFDEPENAMAPVAKKKRGGKAPRQLETRRNLSAIEASESDPSAAGPTPALHVADTGRFGLQGHPVPSTYVGSKPLQSHQTDPQPDLTISPARPYVHDHGTSQGASRSVSRGISRGASRRGASRCGASRGASRSVSHGASYGAPHDHQADESRIPAVQHPAGARIVSRSVSHSVVNQRSGSSIPILNTAVQREPSATMTPHHTIARTPPAFGSFVSQNMSIVETEEGHEEADIEEDEDDVEEDEDDIEEGRDFAEDDGVDNELEGGDFAQDDDLDEIMEHEEDFYGSDTVMHPPHHGDQTYRGSTQARHPTQAPDHSVCSQDEDEDGAGVAGMDRHDRNNHTTSRTAPKRSGLQSTNKQVPSLLNAPVVPNIDYDILQAHHTKNCRPRSPSPTYLSSARNHHPKTKRARTRNSQSSDDCDSDQQDNLEDLNEVDIDSGRRHRTKNAKGAATNRDATNVGFYPSLWQKLLDRAKANFRLYIATSVPFPDKEESIGGTGVCGEVIAEAIIQWQEQKRKLEKGYYPEFKTGMATVVFNDAATFRSKIKQIVLTVVPMVYELALGINGNTTDSVKLKATALLKKAIYLRGEPDSEGRASNFANDAVRIVCHKSFYDNGSKSLKHFAEFQKTIPPAALFLVGTIIRNVICIYSKYGQVNRTKQTPIEDSENSYDRISTLFNRTNKDAYHGPKLRQMLKAWALEGMNVHGAGLGDHEGDDSSEWDVDLA